MHTSTRLTHLQARYAKVLCLQASDPDRFSPSEHGPRHLIRDERYNVLLRSLRLQMAAIWPIQKGHRIHMSERLTSLAEHLLRERCFAAAMVRFPMIGKERALWNKIDRAHTLIRQAMTLVREARDPLDEPLPESDGLIEDVEVLSPTWAGAA